MRNITMIVSLLLLSNQSFCQGIPGGGGIGPADGNEYSNFISVAVSSPPDPFLLINGALTGTADYKMISPFPQPFTECQLTSMAPFVGALPDKVDTASITSVYTEGELNAAIISPAGGPVGAFDGTVVLTSGIDFVALHDQVTLSKPMGLPKGQFDRGRAISKPEDKFDIKTRIYVENSLDITIKVKVKVLKTMMAFEEKSFEVNPNTTLCQTLEFENCPALTATDNGMTYLRADVEFVDAENESVEVIDSLTGRAYVVSE